MIGENHIQETICSLEQKVGSAQRYRIETGVRQVASRWRESDGPPEAFRAFCLEHYIADPQLLDLTLARFETHLESIDGHLHEINRSLLEPLHLDLGPTLPVDPLFAAYAPAAHVIEDLFRTRVAFVALLNFPIYPLEDKLRFGNGWTRKDWARARLAERFSARIPAEIEHARNAAYVSAEDYIARYNIWMGHLLTCDGRRLFPKSLKLISHWGLRDHIKALYADPDGEEKQTLIRVLMERIIRQDIPQKVIDDTGFDWCPLDNTVWPVSEDGAPPLSPTDAEREPDTRYRHLLAIFQAESRYDPHDPTYPTLIDRRFARDRQIPEGEVERLLRSVLEAEEVHRVAAVIVKRLGRPLKAYDIWYSGFKPSRGYQEGELDRVVAKAYPTPQTFQAAIPHLLITLGFDPDMAHFIGWKIVVDPSRGAGHAMGAARRADQVHLRTRIPKEGMDYKGYHIACHELGHTVEQVLSLTRIDHTLLAGVPNTAFSEAFAFFFQAKDMELLGLKATDPNAGPWRILDRFWATYEIAGVALVDMRLWRWMYAHPEASPESLKEAVLEIAQNVWNTYYAPVFGERDVILLAIYSHLIESGLYVPDYPLGFIIAHQIETFLRGRNIGQEMVRMCTLGAITPDAWMREAVGSPISAEPLLEDVRKSVEEWH